VKEPGRRGTRRRGHAGAECLSPTATAPADEPGHGPDVTHVCWESCSSPALQQATGQRLHSIPALPSTPAADPGQSPHLTRAPTQGQGQQAGATQRPRSVGNPLPWSTCPNQPAAPMHQGEAAPTKPLLVPGGCPLVPVITSKGTTRQHGQPRWPGRATPLAEHTPKPSPGHRPPLRQQAQPSHRKTSSCQRPGRGEVTLPLLALSARYGFLPLMKSFQRPYVTPSSPGRDGPTRCQEAGWHRAALRKRLRPQRGPSRNAWPRSPSSPSPEGLGNAAVRVWVSFPWIFPRLGARGGLAALLQPGSLLAAGLWHAAGAAAALGREHSHLFPSPARSASQAANWDTSPRHKRLDKCLRPHESPFPSQEGVEPGEVQAQRVLAGCQPPWAPSHRTGCPCSPITGAALQLAGGRGSSRAPPPAHTSPSLPRDTGARSTARWQLFLVRAFTAATS